MAFLAGRGHGPALVFEYDAMADLWTCSPGLCDLYGIPPGQPPTTAAMLERVVDEDRAVVLEWFQHLLRTACPFSFPRTGKRVRGGDDPGQR